MPTLMIIITMVSRHIVYYKDVIHCYHHDYDKGISMVSRYTAIGFMTYKAIQYYVYSHNMCVTLSQHYIHTH